MVSGATQKRAKGTKRKRTKKAAADACKLRERRQWRLINFGKESFKRPHAIREKRHLCFNVRKGGQRASLLEIFLKFLPPAFVTKIASEIPEHELRYFNGWTLRLSLKKIYCILAIKIRIYGEQCVPVSVKARTRPLRLQIKAFKKYFEEKYLVKTFGIVGCELVLSHFLVDSTYLEELSANFMSIVRHIGTYVAGDEKLLRFFGESDNVRVVFSKPDRVGLWFYQLASILSNGLSYLLHLCLHDVSKLDEGSFPVSQVVQMWCRHVLDGPYVDKDVDTLLVFDSFYHSSSTREFLNRQNVKYIGAVHPNRFKLQTDMLKKKIRKVGDFAGVYNKTTGEIIVQYYAKPQHGQKDAKIRTAMSNAYTRYGRRGTHHHRPAIDAYKKKFGVCDLFNRQIKYRIWPHKHGGKGVKGERGKQDSFAFGCILQNTFNAYRDINDITSEEYDYHSFCMQLADQVYMYALEQSTATI